jgi:hypothetical protein
MGGCLKFFTQPTDLTYIVISEFAQPPSFFNSNGHRYTNITLNCCKRSDCCFLAKNLLDKSRMVHENVSHRGRFCDQKVNLTTNCVICFLNVGDLPMQKFLLIITTDSERPIDNGRIIHALKLAHGLQEKGYEVKIVFAGRAVTWIPKFSTYGMDTDVPKLVSVYGKHFDAIKERIEVCNMCAKRFGVRNEVESLAYRIVGESNEHLDAVDYLADGYVPMTF